MTTEKPRSTLPSSYPDEHQEKSTVTTIISPSCSPTFETVTMHLPAYHYGSGGFTIETEGSEHSADRYRGIQNAQLNDTIHRES